MGNQNQSVTRDQIVTVNDLIEFKKILLLDIRKLLSAQGSGGGRQWVKALEIRKLFGFCDTKLQYLRSNGLIPFRKLGRVTYYNLEEINQMMNAGKLNAYLK